MSAIYFALSAILLSAVALFLAYRFFFLRHPARKIPYGSSVVSPANGKVSRIIKLKSGQVAVRKNKGAVFLDAKGMGNECWLVVIVLNLWNVHYQRSPIEGEIVGVKYRKGRFRNAVWKAKELRSFENEHNAITIRGSSPKRTVKVVQIAGLVARRIHCFVKKGDRVRKGQTLGLISLGSQVAVMIPGNHEIKVGEGDVVVDGTTVLAELK